ncbi:MAG TPA: bifunctional adenosylcobinamide kinase/adenosylcobinamide-phosphate guanylyltransferase [Gaiellaceae bacterium]|nr:bifunctional adenosylcobinamide kinase/adenosylcobinamide-phosphate guanylyltransferase [Gaiellaceae bacterium]
MSLVLLLGGARSGKSALAVRLAGDRATFLATGTAEDDEMAARIERHRAERPAGWATIEEPLALRSALESVDAAETVVVDCLSLWVSNLLGAGSTDDAVEEEAAAVARGASARDGVTVVVSNEVGLGIVPMNPLGRRYRDLLGTVNRLFAAEAERALLVVAGRGLELGRL